MRIVALWLLFFLSLIGAAVFAWISWQHGTVFRNSGVGLLGAGYTAWAVYSRLKVEVESA